MGEKNVDARVDSERRRSLQSNVTTDSVSQLAALLESDDSDERAGAAWRLVEAVDSQPATVRGHLDALTSRVDDPDVWVRRGVTWVLAELADTQPDALADRFPNLVSLARSDDPLVTQNAVVAVAAVTKAYPARATTGLSTLAALTDSGNALVERYAREAVREVAAALESRADDAGYPMVVRSHEAYASLLPDDATVVTVNADEEDRTRPVAVSFGQETPVQTGDSDEDGPEHGPPDEVPEVPSVSLSLADLSPSRTLREGPLTTDYKATVAESTLEHGVVTLRRLTAEDSAVCAAFRDAVEWWASVDGHDHVATLMGRGPRWVVARFDEGETLAQRGSPSSLAEALWQVTCVTRAVSHAHSRGVVHGGLHPGAVRFVETAENAWDAPTVADWGFAHAVSGLQTPPVPPGYAAPEHVDPDAYGEFDQSTDVFGLGALTYGLLTGTAPSTGGSDRIDATELNPDLPASVEKLFARALAPEKASRFATVLDFQRALDELAADVVEVAGWR
ncbi:protein kinase domain-containing protein [Halobacterium zhouii]|uniref:protein kinase domain-containing protein n=1 Tax=Halobacterium zhouii TaxID=2902624 RepID=UPI001E284329|nr:protein kinase [Halobacterium zhouii]